MATRGLNEVFTHIGGLEMADNGKTFTQEEVNAIVSGRVNEIESRYSGYV